MICNLFLPLPDTDFRDFLDEADKLACFAPEGNAADSIELVPVIHDLINRTGVIPEMISADDSFAANREM